VTPLFWFLVSGLFHMWNDRLRIAERVASDWSALSDEERKIALSALQTIDDDPIAGAPLFEPLRGLWSYRAEHLRIIYRIVAEARFVAVMSIGRAAP
jgi:mRNA-degrading endonuclease RelE of RelBE toxin-antitoxin system